MDKEDLEEYLLSFSSETEQSLQNENKKNFIYRYICCNFCKWY